MPVPYQLTEDQKYPSCRGLLYSSEGKQTINKLYLWLNVHVCVCTHIPNTLAGHI